MVPGRVSAWPGTHASRKRRRRRESRHSASGSVADDEVTAQDGLDLVVRHETKWSAGRLGFRGCEGRRGMGDGRWAM